MDTVINIPVVTMLMPVYNGERYLREAIESILRQNFNDFEFLIINDGSTDGSVAIIKSFNDNRIRLIHNEGNIGLVNTLNKGIELALGKYIVRMDCDDISEASRLTVQVKWMENNKHIGASGSYYYKLINGKKVMADFPLNSSEISCFLLFNSPIAHPSAIIKKEVVMAHNIRYRSEYIHAEDYDLWSQISEHAALTNIPLPLLTYRVHASQITSREELVLEKAKSVNEIRLRHLKQFGITPSEEELALHSLISDGLAPVNANQLSAGEKWLAKLIAFNTANKVFNHNYFQKIVLERWLRFCFNYLGTKKGISYFLKSEVNKRIRLSPKMRFELFGSIYYSWKRKRIKE